MWRSLEFGDGQYAGGNNLRDGLIAAVPNSDMKHSFEDAVTSSDNTETEGFTQRLEKGIQRLSSGLASSKAGALIQVSPVHKLLGVTRLGPLVWGPAQQTVTRVACVGMEARSLFTRPRAVVDRGAV